ncbi:hypothetical protein OH809_41810 [Streptomyces sp. NBC_00873]|uniref:hypothetical protein n=1 Tax=unclassified Streptomyces TaxID=2593676 RepID=UPI00386DDB3C|nr:hypothetical protein OH809_01900 [Streptomyces sp. NBC_00873]WSY96637.1 hypothetical protein OH809_41810 [Streptomyces sp. NBC_00873]WTA41589.1 hypothetical protein OH821_01895 [Streptomyces sp. NBC_00842]WTA48307.1 hypothetical protein OH821_41915 [Streptomyces sp. NBC_00842]
MTRDHGLGWLQRIAETPTGQTGKPLGVVSRIQRSSGLGQFFRGTAAWQWDGVPGYSLIGPGGSPKSPVKVPRFIPDGELDWLMPVVGQIACPFQCAVLLVARWSGARRDEVRRLPADCLDRYPDGTARLRLSAGKTLSGTVRRGPQYLPEVRVSVGRLHLPQWPAVPGPHLFRVPDVPADRAVRQPRLVQRENRWGWWVVVVRGGGGGVVCGCGGLGWGAAGWVRGWG